jgi:CubicO group peptidase (beta-lactamase class C family)
MTNPASASTCQNPPPTIDTSAPIMSNQAVADAVNGLEAKITGLGLGSSSPGFSVGVIYDQSLLFAAGFGCANIEKTIAATPDTIYHIESLTKVFDATMMMQLRDCGKFALTDQVNQYVPEAWYQAFSLEPVPLLESVSPTFLELSSHTAGLPDQMFVGLSSAAEFFAKLQTEVVAPQPWPYSYSDIGFVTLGQSDAIIAAQSWSGQTYHTWVDDKIFSPLSMTNSVFGYANADQSLLAMPYHRKKGSTGPFHAAPDNGYADGFPPAGSIYTNVWDMAQFIMLQFRTGPVGGDQILASSSIQEMFRPVAPTQGNGSIGIGWFVAPFGEKYTVISKNGGDAWWASLARMIPELKLGVVAFANTGTAGLALTKLEKAIFSLMIPALASVTPATSLPDAKGG